jgi:hypothetical protein
MTIERRLLTLYVLAILLLLVPASGFAAEKEPAVPRLEDRVTDLAQVFSAERKKRLIDELAVYEKETSHQIAVLTVPSLAGEGLEVFSLRVANAWGLGQKDKDNGILLVLAMKERQVRIEVGKGLEATISNERAQEIIQSEMVPAFRQGDYAEGLEKGAHRLMQEARGRSSSFVECRVEAKVLGVEKKAAVDAAIAKELDLEEAAIGKMGVVKMEIAVTKSSSKAGQQADCTKLVGVSGPVVAFYELADKTVRLEKGAVLPFDYLGYAGFAPYGVPGQEVWTIRPPSQE